MTTYTVYRGTSLVTSFEVESSGPVERQAMTGIQRIAIVGASIVDQSFNSTAKRDETMALIRNAGIDSILSVNTTYSNSGDRSQDYIEKLDSMLADAAPFEGMLFIIHGFGNDITQQGPWPGGAVDYESRMRTIIGRILDAGHRVAWTSTTYRLPGSSNPSAPYNARINTPVIAELTPDFMDGDKPWFDYYALTYKHQPYIEPDGVHPDDRGQALIRGYTARRLADLINPTKPAAFADFLGKTVVFTVGSDLHQVYSDGINGYVANVEPGDSASATNGYGHCLQVYDADGSPLNGVTLFTQHGNTNTVGASTDSGVADILNAIVVSQSVWASPDAPGIAVIDGLPNGLTGTMTIVAARDATDVRSGDYSFAGNTQVADGAWQEGDTPATLSWPFTVENGQLRLDWTVTEGSSYAYLNGIMLEFDA